MKMKKMKNVMLHLQCRTYLPVRILRRAKNYQVMVKDNEREFVDEIKIVQAQANVVRNKEGK